MTVKSFLKNITSYENVCVEDRDYNVFDSGVASDVMNGKYIKGLNVVEAYIGIRSVNISSKSTPCIVILAEHK